MHGNDSSTLYSDCCLKNNLFLGGIKTFKVLLKAENWVNVVTIELILNKTADIIMRSDSSPSQKCRGSRFTI